MATNWPPAAGTYPAWPPVEIPCGGRLEFSDIGAGIECLTDYGFTKANPTSQENQAFFQGVRCDHNHPCSGIMLVSPQGRRYPFAYCTGATHKACLALWITGYDSNNDPLYEMGSMSANL